MKKHMLVLFSLIFEEPDFNAQYFNDIQIHNVSHCFAGILQIY